MRLHVFGVGVIIIVCVLSVRVTKSFVASVCSS